MRILCITFLMLLTLIFAGTVTAQEQILDEVNDYLVIREIIILGNRVTKPGIIERELLFNRGDTIKKMELIPAIQRSRENLLNTSLFNFVFFDANHYPEDRIDILISVTERWYIWPVPILELADRNLSTFLKNKEWDRINYGMWLKWNNFRGRREVLTGKLRLGYKKEYALTYSIPNMGKRQQHGFSTGFAINDQSELNYTTLNNVPVYYNEGKGHSHYKQEAFASYTYRRKFYVTHQIKFDYNLFAVSDSVLILNPDYLGNGDAKLRFFSLGYLFEHDLRDSKIYPMDGYAFKFKAQQCGLGIFEDFRYPHLKLTGTFFYHQRLDSRLYFGNATKAQFSTQKELPYVFKKALGYYENLSGYEYYVIDGTDYFLTKYYLKFELLKQRTSTIPFIKMEQFNKIHYALYINIFADAGYVYNGMTDPTNTMTNDWQFSTGIGLDIVTYYDQVFRIEYAINRLGEGGIFVNIETPFRRW
ncbi:MAG: BamA/TamA family outer membrane protein [Bacteroidales bacterium]|nr:BamA/TamA family outer membrane protein [Bacteroidales bacterium]MBN2699053.1 BamA/TamA family outer membrane protein [Bacteroidales bacterium]